MNDTDASTLSCRPLPPTRPAPRSQKVLSQGRAVTPDYDRWSLRYVTRSPSSTPNQQSHFGERSRGSPHEDSAIEELTRPVAFRSSSGRHLSAPPTANRHARAPDDPSAGDSYPNISPGSRNERVPPDGPKDEHEVEETISRAFGSVLDPVAQRSKWKCSGCETLFVRVSASGPSTHPDSVSDLRLFPFTTGSNSVSRSEGKRRRQPQRQAVLSSML